MNITILYAKKIWKYIPLEVRDLLPLRLLIQWLKPYLKTKLTNTSPNKGPQGELTDLASLDKAIEYASYLEETNQDEFFRYIQTISFKRPKLPPEFPDPFSRAYYQKQFEFYQDLTNRKYNVSSEALRIYVNKTIDDPYPYATKSSTIVGNKLIAMGELLKVLNLSEGAKILEMGPGHGNNTLQFVQLGYQVTCIDISNDFLKVVRGRLGKLGKKAKLICADFESALNMNDTFDAIIFNSSFHHCAEHQKLIAGLASKLSSHGKIIFCEEPINNSFDIPWGLRLDGESIFHIRLHGWLELGFREDYFSELIRRSGLVLNKTEGTSGPLFVASKQNN